MQLNFTAVRNVPVFPVTNRLPGKTKPVISEENTAKLANRKVKWLILALCTVFFSLLAHTGYSQKLTLSFKNAPLATVLHKIEKQTDYQFLFFDSDLKQAKAVTIEVNNTDLKKVLQQCFEGQPYTYKIVDKTIVIKLSKAPTKLPANTDSTISIKGRLINGSGEPITGASIQLLKTKAGTVSDDLGNFKIPSVSDKAVVIINALGYAPVTMQLFSGHFHELPSSARSDSASGSLPLLLSNHADSLLIRMAESTNSLDKVQIVAYGQTLKRFQTGSISSIKKEDIERQPVNNLASALQGMVAGLEVSNNSGVPGDEVQIRIRGINSINGGSPLILIDNVPADINTVAPADVESVEVLKDAAATAIYGARGSNGVLLITTKKGKIGKGKVGLHAYQSLTAPTRLTPTLNSQQYLELRKEAYKNDNVNYTPTTAPDLFLDSTVNTDWADKLYKVASAEDYQVNFSGGNEDLQYYFSGGMRNENSTMLGPWKNNRYNLRTSIDARISQRVRAGGSLAYTYINNYTFNNAIAPILYYALPLIPFEDASGNPNLQAYYPSTNPNRFLTTYTKSHSNNVMGNLYVDYKMLDGLDFRTDGNFTSSTNQYMLFSPSTANIAEDPSNFGNYQNGNNISINVEPKLSYERKFGEHAFKLLAAGTYRSSNVTSYSMQMSNPSNAIDDLNTPDMGTVTSRDYSEEPYRFASIFGRLNYRYKNKYLLEGVIRRDGSSRFGPENKFGTFWSLAGGYIFSQEPFIKDLLGSKFFGKLRVSYGTTGTDQIGSFRYIANSPQVSIPYMDQTTLYVGNLANPELKWEETKKFDVGLDLNLLNDRVNLTADYYSSNTNGMLYTDFLSRVTGFGSIVRNLPGLVRNTGFELQLNTTPVKTQDWRWNTAFNISFIKNKLVSLPALSDATFAAKYVYQVGKPLDLIWGLKYQGVDPETGLAKFQDVDNNGKILTYSPDYQVIGKRLPDFFGGWTNNISYKKFDLNLFAQFVNGITKGYTFISGIGSPYNLPLEALNRWQKPGDITNIPRAAAPGTVAAAINNNIAQSDFAYDDASYIRIKNITLSYSFDKINKAISKLQLYLTGYNLFTITKFKGDDPEGGPNLVPMSKIYTLGINVTF